MEKSKDNIINFPKKIDGNKNENKSLGFTDAVSENISHILEFNDKYNFLLEKIKKLYPENKIKWFSDLDTYKFDYENQQFIFMYKWAYWFINLKNICEFELAKQAEELEAINDLIMDYWNIIASWYSFVNFELLTRITNIYIDYANKIIEFTLWWQKYICSLEENKKPFLKIV